MRVSLILFFQLISSSIFSQEGIDNSSIVINKIKTQLANEKINDFFFYSINCFGDVAPIEVVGVAPVKSDTVHKFSQINEFKIYCFWAKNNEFFIQKFTNNDNNDNNFNVLNISKPIKLEKFEGFKIISGNFEKIKKEKILDAEIYFYDKLMTIDKPESCITKFAIFSNTNAIYSDFLSFKITEKESINYNKNKKLNIVKLYHQCEQKINDLGVKNSFITIQKKKILE
jgi:hypothetical protein